MGTTQRERHRGKTRKDRELKPPGATATGQKKRKTQTKNDQTKAKHKKDNKNTQRDKGNQVVKVVPGRSKRAFKPRNPQERQQEKGQQGIRTGEDNRTQRL